MVHNDQIMLELKEQVNVVPCSVLSWTITPCEAPVVGVQYASLQMASNLINEFGFSWFSQPQSSYTYLCMYSSSSSSLTLNSSSFTSTKHLTKQKTCQGQQSDRTEQKSVAKHTFKLIKWVRRGNNVLSFLMKSYLKCKVEAQFGFITFVFQGTEVFPINHWLCGVSTLHITRPFCHPLLIITSDM